MSLTETQRDAVLNAISFFFNDTEAPTLDDDELEALGEAQAILQQKPEPGALTPEVLDLMKVAHACASPDEWNVPSMYVSILEDHAFELASGIPAASIIAHGKHTGLNCCFMFRRFREEPRERTCAVGGPKC